MTTSRSDQQPLLSEFRSPLEDLKHNLKAVIRGLAARADLVTREEFEAQKRTLENLEQQLKQLQQQAANKAK